MASRNEYRFAANRTPELARARAEVCKTYRYLRRQSPDLARRLFVALRAGERVIKDALISRLYAADPNQSVGGLASLVRGDHGSRSSNRN
jgi:hypothetical protein